MQVTQKYLPVPSQRRSGEAIIGVKYIVAHDTANDGSTALQNVNYYINSADDMQASAHAFADDTGVIECVPLTEKAWHVRYNAGIAPNVAGSFANDYAIGVELCYSTRGKFDTQKAYQNYVTYIAQLCFKYKLNPNINIVAHGTLDPVNRTDPFNAFGKIGKTWTLFIADVYYTLSALTIPPVADPLVSVQIPQSKVAQVLAYLKTI